MSNTRFAVAVFTGLLIGAHTAIAQQGNPASTFSRSADPTAAAIEAVPEPAHAEEPGCLSAHLKAVTDRPTPSSAADTTQCGVLEILTGPERLWLGHGIHQDDIAPSLQFGLTPRLDLHYARGTFFQLGNQAEPLAGIGDTFVGARYKLTGDHHLLPSFGAFYTLKVPTASVVDGLGTGRYDHSLIFLASKDVLPKLHIDFNVGPNLAGRPSASGFDKNTAMTLYGYYPGPHNLTLGLGSYGSTTLNASTPAYAMISSALDWQITPGLILDAGFDEGVTPGGPHKRLTFGFTFAAANLYAIVRGPREQTK